MRCLGALVLPLALVGLQLAAAQNTVTDCTDISTDLGTEPIDPTIVSDLPVCVNQRNVAQCCSTMFIFERLNISREDFLDGLRDELRDRFESFEDIVDRLRTFLENDFVTRYFRGLGDLTLLNNGSALVDDFRSTLRNHLEFDPDDDDDDDDDDETTPDREGDTDRDGFNVVRFLREMVSRFENAAVEQLARSSVERGQCIRQVIEGNIEQQRMEAQAAAIQQIRRVLASIERLRAFIRNFTNDLAGFRPLQECVYSLVRRNTCGRCIATRPLFCRNVCRAIATACYSPFNRALRVQLENLWEVVRRILDAATDALGDLNANRGFLRVDAATIIREVITQCGRNSNNNGANRRQSDDNRDDSDDERSSRIPLLPLVVRTAAMALRGGPFEYEGRSVSGPGLCRRLRTARMNCWDGENERPTDIPEFEGNDIDDQVNNPVIDLDENELEEQAAALGTPVSSFLQDPSFAQVAPAGLVLPGDENVNGATQVIHSFTLFVLMLIAGILLLV